MHVVVTGAGGFVGRALVQRLLADAGATPRPLARLTAIDRQFDVSSAASDPRLRRLSGDFADPDLLARALAPAPDWLFHLASVPGSLAEREPALGLQANLLGPLALLQQLAEVAGAAGADGAPPPRVVFASTVAVYGTTAASSDGSVDESMPARPAISYGAHKLMTEILLADLTRRGVLDGVSLRLPGIVARPSSPSGHGSAFMSDLLRRLLAGQPYVCPVSAQAQCWWMSLACCVDNLLHAARLPAAAMAAELVESPSPRSVQLPVITATVGEVVAAIETVTGRPADLRFAPDAAIETLFGRQPRLATPTARALGFVDDGSLDALVRAATALDDAG